MAKPTEHKTVQTRILAYAQEIGWKYVPREEAERRRRFFPLPKDAAREMMEYQLMVAQIRVHDLDLGDILQQSAAEIGEGTFQPTVVGNGRDRSLLGCCASGGMSEFAGRKHSGLKYDR